MKIQLSERQPDQNSPLRCIGFKSGAAKSCYDSGGVKRAMRLPKLESIKLNGDYQIQPAFWDQLNTAIHNGSHLDNASKFTYLRPLLIVNAAIAIQQCLTSSGLSYEDAVVLLKEQCGNNDRIEGNCMIQLLPLIPVRSRNST